MSRLLVIVPLLGFLALAVFLSLSLSKEGPVHKPSALVGRQAPEAVAALTGLAPERPALAPGWLADGEVKLVNFWASWCPPCREEHPVLMELAERGVSIVGVNYKDEQQDAIAFLEENGDPFAVVAADRSGRAAIDWGVSGAPETFVVDGDGVIRDKHSGALTAEIAERMLDAARRPLKRVSGQAPGRASGRASS